MSRAHEMLRDKLAVPIAVAVTTVGLQPSAAHAQRVDTSEWVCEFCPFATGHSGEFDVGALSVSESGAYVGDAIGIEEDGVYADIDGAGVYVGERSIVRWRIDDLGVDSRALGVTFDRPGAFDAYVDYSELPRRESISTRTVFALSSNALTLPSGWVRSSTTSGMSTLNASLAPRAIESDRSTFGIGGRWQALEGFSVGADYRRREQDGVRVRGGAYFTNAALLPVPIDYVTDEFELALRYATSRWGLSLTWRLSDFQNGSTEARWQHPFTTVPGAESAELAQPPDNRFQQLALAGTTMLPAGDTRISASIAVGEAEQTEAFLPYTLNSNLATTALPATTLDGQVDTTRFAIAASSRPLPKTRVKISYRFDERDNQTPIALWNRVIADSFVSGEFEANVPYSFERRSLTARADYDLLDDVRVSAGYERRETDRDFQEVAEQTENSGWGRIRWRPRASLELDVRGGAAKRDIDRYDETVAASFGQNPLLRKYELAYRYREFVEATVRFAPVEAPVSIDLSTRIADDSYTQSLLGLTASEEEFLNIDLTWSPADNTSIYVNAGAENIDTAQTGSQSFAQPDWRATHDDEFRTIGFGLRMNRLTERLGLRLDYIRSDGTTAIVVTDGGNPPDAFPDIRSKHDFLRASLAYRRSERTTFELRIRYQRFDMQDWSLDGIGPATLPTILGLGARAYDDDIFMFGLGVRYRLGATPE